MNTGLGLWGIWSLISVLRIAYRLESESSIKEREKPLDSNSIIPILVDSFTLAFGVTSILYFAIFLEMPAWASTNFVRLALLIGVVSIVTSSVKREKKNHQ